MNTTITPCPIRSARAFGCTVEQAKALMAKNAAGLKQMADRAALTGRKVSGYSESELRESAQKYSTASA